MTDRHVSVAELELSYQLPAAGEGTPVGGQPIGSPAIDICWPPAEDLPLVD
jgi:hypothetical protein